MGVVAVSLLVFAIQSLFSPEPLPSVADEFSYLLAADTFSHGRLTNPPHPMWEPFEALHIIQQPTYASKYPPGQGMTLALGKVMTGHAIVGVWLTSALACAATAWMLLGWLSPMWAVAGGLATALHPLIVNWNACYWGGGLATLGGALVCGALPRLVRRPSRRQSALFALGAFILANTRPYEGLILVGYVACCLVAAYGRRRVAWRSPHMRTAISTAFLLFLAGGLWIGYYNWRCTGSAWTMPYAVHEKTYATAPVFAWQSSLDPPTYRHSSIQRYHRTEELLYRKQHSWGGFFHGLIHAKLPAFRRHLLPFTAAMLTTIVLGGIRLVRDHRIQFAAGGTVAVLLGTSVCLWWMPHYHAPAFPLLVLYVVTILRWCTTLRVRTIPVGRVMLAGILLIEGYAIASQLPSSPESKTTIGRSFAQRRAEVAHHLEQLPGNHLVIVCYLRGSQPQYEWVSNEAELDDAKVLWARNMGRHRNRELVEYFPDRVAWILETTGLDATIRKCVSDDLIRETGPD